MKNSEVNNNNKNTDGKIKNILYIWYLKRIKLPYGRIMKHRSIIYAHGGMKKRGSTNCKIMLQW